MKNPPIPPVATWKRPPASDTPTMSAAEYRKLTGQAPPGADRVRFRTESEFQGAVVSWWDQLTLDDPAPFLFHVPNGGKRDRVTAAILVGQGVRPGVADLGLMLPAGRFAWIELKTEDGKPSPQQIGFAARCLRLGHAYTVARTFADVTVALAAAGVRYSEPIAARLIREGA